MQCMALPKRLLNNIDRVNRNFLWDRLKIRKRLIGSDGSDGTRSLSLQQKVGWVYNLPEVKI